MTNPDSISSATLDHVVAGHYRKGNHPFHPDLSLTQEDLVDLVRNLDPDKLAVVSEQGSVMALCRDAETAARIAGLLNLAAVVVERGMQSICPTLPSTAHVVLSIACGTRGSKSVRGGTVWIGDRAENRALEEVVERSEWDAEEASIALQQIGGVLDDDLEVWSCPLKLQYSSAMVPPPALPPSCSYRYPLGSPVWFMQDNRCNSGIARGVTLCVWHYPEGRQPKGSPQTTAQVVYQVATGRQASTVDFPEETLFQDQESLLASLRVEV